MGGYKFTEIYIEQNTLCNLMHVEGLHNVFFDIFYSWLEGHKTFHPIGDHRNTTEVLLDMHDPPFQVNGSSLKEN